MRSRRVVPVALALVLGLSIWEWISVASSRWLPGIVEVAVAAVGILDSETLMADLGATIRRVLTVWLATVVVGVAIGVAAGFWWWLRALLRPVLAVYRPGPRKRAAARPTRGRPPGRGELRRAR